ncbi:MAG: FecR family protein [Rhizobiaceae bacterium]
MRHAFILLSIVACIGLVSASAQAQQVGVTSAVNPAASGTPPGGRMRTLTIGETVVHNEHIDTDTRGLLQVLLADGTTFTVGPNSGLVIDSFVYDPDKGTAKITASLTKGVFRFIGGRTSKTPDGVRLNTPVGTVGIRGGIANLVFNPQPGIPPHIDLVFGDSVQLWRNDQRLARLYARGYSIWFDPDGEPHVRRTDKGWLRILQGLLGGRSGQHGGAKRLPSDELVEQSTLPQSNSGLTPSFGDFPTPFPSPDTSIVQQGGEDHNRNSIFDPCYYCCDGPCN